MKQRNTWMLCLSIGIISSLTLSCTGQTEYIDRAEYLYINTTEHVITTPFGYTTNGLGPDIIEPNDTLSIVIDGDGPKNTTPENYVPPLVGNLTFYFGEDRYITYKSTSAGKGDGPTDIRNYNAKKIATNDFIFTYTFTQEDYNNATPIESGK